MPRGVWAGGPGGSSQKYHSWVYRNIGRYLGGFSAGTFSRQYTNKGRALFGVRFVNYVRAMGASNHLFDEMNYWAPTSSTEME